MTPAKRITLTKSQIATPFGNALAQELQAISEDGRFELEEIQKLHELLSETPSDLPAGAFLKRLTTSVLLDRQLDDHEAYELRLAIERVLPKALRAKVSDRLSGIVSPGQEDNDDDPEPATERQLDYIRVLGGKAPPDLRKWAASDLIDNLKQSAPPSNRQMMVLRFWGRCDLASGGRVAISEWMDRHYGMDSDHLEAWELFKRDLRDDGSQRDPSWVPVNVGHEYLRRVKSRRENLSTEPPLVQTQGESTWIRAVIAAALLLLIYLAAQLLY